MPGLESLMVIAAGTLIGLAMVAGLAAWCWRGWLELKKAELGCGRGRFDPASGTQGRIEVADLKERVRKLEAIAAGVEY